MNVGRFNATSGQNFGGYGWKVPLKKINTSIYHYRDFGGPDAVQFSEGKGWILCTFPHSTGDAFYGSDNIGDPDWQDILSVEGDPVHDALGGFAGKLLYLDGFARSTPVVPTGVNHTLQTFYDQINCGNRIDALDGTLPSRSIDSEGNPISDVQWESQIVATYNNVSVDFISNQMRHPMVASHGYGIPCIVRHFYDRTKWKKYMDLYTMPWAHVWGDTTPLADRYF
jgi:hypothetical protein